jgi:hypothetical protein
METPTPLGFTDWPFDGSEEQDGRMEYRAPRSTKPMRVAPRAPFNADQMDMEPHVLQDADDYEAARARAFQMGYDVEPRHSQAQLQRYHQQRQYQRAMQREFGADSFRRATSHPEHELYARGRAEPLDDLSFDPPHRIPRSAPPPAAASSPLAAASSPLASFGLRPNGLMHARARRFIPSFGPRVDELPLEPAMLDMYPSDEADVPPTTAPLRRREYSQQAPPRRLHQQMQRRPQSAERLEGGMMMSARRSFHDPDLPRDRRGGESRAVYEELVPTPAGRVHSEQNNDFAHLTPARRDDELVTAANMPPSNNRQRSSQQAPRPEKAKRPRLDDPEATAAAPVAAVEEPAAPSPPKVSKAKAAAAKKPAAKASSAGGTPTEAKDGETQPKRRCGRKSMNYSSEQKRERNRAAVKKCRQRQALKLEYLQHKAESLAAENQALSEMLVKNTELDEEQRTSLTRGIQMDILLKIKEIFTQSLPKDFVLDADSIWDLNSVLAVSMPSRCYYGIESIKDFWRTSLRMRNKGKIRSFWAWLFRLPPGDRFSEFDIQPFSPTSNLYFISWTTKSTPPLAGSMVIMFGNGHRVTLHVECFGWLIWRYLLTNEPFPEPPME